MNGLAGQIHAFKPKNVSDCISIRPHSSLALFKNQLTISQHNLFSSLSILSKARNRAGPSIFPVILRMRVSDGGAPMMAPGAVAVAVKSAEGKGSQRAVRWAVENLMHKADRLVLVHVMPKITSVPTPCMLASLIFP